MKATPEVIAAIREGAEFRVQSEDAHIITFATGDQRHICGVRVYLRSDSGRWQKTGMWIVANTDAGRPNTNIEALAALARGLEGPKGTTQDQCYGNGSVAA